MYVAVPRDLPAERRRLMLKDSGASSVLAAADHSLAGSRSCPPAGRSNAPLFTTNWRARSVVDSAVIKQKRAHASTPDVAAFSSASAVSQCPILGLLKTRMRDFYLPRDGRLVFRAPESIVAASASTRPASEPEGSLKRIFSKVSKLFRAKSDAHEAPRGPVDPLKAAFSRIYPECLNALALQCPHLLPRDYSTAPEQDILSHLREALRASARADRDLGDFLSVMESARLSFVELCALLGTPITGNTRQLLQALVQYGYTIHIHFRYAEFMPLSTAFQFLQFTWAQLRTEPWGFRSYWDMFDIQNADSFANQHAISADDDDDYDYGATSGGVLSAEILDMLGFSLSTENPCRPNRETRIPELGGILRHTHALGFTFYVFAGLTRLARLTLRDWIHFGFTPTVARQMGMDGAGFNQAHPLSIAEICSLARFSESEYRAFVHPPPPARRITDSPRGVLSSAYQRHRRHHKRRAVASDSSSSSSSTSSEDEAEETDSDDDAGDSNSSSDSSSSSSSSDSDNDRSLGRRTAIVHTRTKVKLPSADTKRRRPRKR